MDIVTVPSLRSGLLVRGSLHGKPELLDESRLLLHGSLVPSEKEVLGHFDFQGGVQLGEWRFKSRTEGAVLDV